MNPDRNVVHLAGAEVPADVQMSAAARLLMRSAEDAVELGEYYAAHYWFASMDIDKDLEEARQHLRTLELFDEILPTLTTEEQVQALRGLHNHAVSRATSAIKWAQRLLHPDEEVRTTIDGFPAAPPPEGWPTYDDVEAGRHDGVRWTVPLRERFVDADNP